MFLELNQSLNYKSYWFMVYWSNIELNYGQTNDVINIYFICTKIKNKL